MAHSGSAYRRYMRRFVSLMVLYVVTLSAVTYWFAHGGPAGPLRYVVGVLPALPVIGIIAAIFAFVVEQEDEYLRLIQVKQVLYGTGFALTVTTAWGFLEAYGLVPHVDAYWTFLLFCIGMIPSAIAYHVRERRLRSEKR